MENKHDDLGELLRDEYGGPAFPREKIRARVRRSTRHAGHRPSAIRLTAQVAAALLIFVLGSEYGRLTAASNSTTSSPTPTPIELQQAGSQYVQQLARVLSTPEAYSETQVLEIRQIAVAILYATAIELQAEGDDHIALVAALLEASRDQQYTSTNTDPQS